ncbi:MAG: PIN domain-containing protein [Acidobacteriota bacterium]
MRLLLDTTVLSRLCYPFREENRSLVHWFEEASRADHLVCLPEIADYETRRGLLHLALRSGRSTTRSLQHLDRLGGLLAYLPLTTSVLRRAAGLWADARFKGIPTGSSLDADVILAAQALEIQDAAVITDNLRHLGRFVPSYRWQEAPLS